MKIQLITNVHVLILKYKIECDYSCETCLDDAKNCVTCSAESLRILQIDL